MKRAMHTTRTGITIGCAHQRRPEPTPEELRLQFALLGQRRREGLLRRSAAALALCYEIGVILALLGAATLVITLKEAFNGRA